MLTVSTLPPPSSSPPPSPIVKICSCCARTFTAEWFAAPSIGLQDDGDGAFLRLVNCACGSTIALPHAETSG